MRQAQKNNSNRMRGRGRGNKSPNPMSRNFESNGPDVKIRGNAGHIAEKYASLARDAQSSGDRVMAENYLQHAEHYNRLVAAAAAQQEERRQAENQQRENKRDAQSDGEGGNNSRGNKKAVTGDSSNNAEAEAVQGVLAAENENGDDTQDNSEKQEKQARGNGRAKTQRPRKTKNAKPSDDENASKADNGITEDASGLPEGLLTPVTPPSETVGADE